MFITPDYGHSDFMHFNIPIRMEMSKSIKHFQIPLWEPGIGQGFPLFDEGQMGFFYLPNMVLFFLFPFWLAFNLGYVTTFLIAAFGTYFLVRSYGLKKTASFAAAITFTFSSIFVFHLHHYNLIQTASLTPWFFYLINSFIKTGRYIYLLIFPFLLAQQHLIGFPQLTFYTLIFTSLFFIIRIMQTFRPKLERAKLLIIFSLIVLAGTLMASVQLEATYRLSKNAHRLNNFSPQKILDDFPYLPKNLLSVLDPYILGKPQLGTYPQWKPGKWGIFWESNSYFGIVQLILVSGFLLSLLLKTSLFNKNREVLIWTAFGLLGILLSLGKNAPLHPVFSLPVISSFRVPSRFLLFSFLSAAVITGYAIDRISRRHSKKLVFISFVILLTMITDIYRLFFSYSLTIQKSRLFSEPQITRTFEQNSGRIISISQEVPWNKTFLNNGWTNQEENYLFFKNLMGQNLNLLFNNSHLWAYAGMAPRRVGLSESISKSGIKILKEKLTIDKASQKLMNMTGVEYLTSPYILDSQNWNQQDKIESGENSIYLYKNLHTLPHVYTVKSYKIASSVQDVEEQLSKDDFDETATVILEKEPPGFVISPETFDSKIEIDKYENQKVTINADLKTDSIAVLSDSFDPAWKAFVDGKPTEILAANINSRAVVVQKGKHTIEFDYERKDIKTALTISTVTFLISLAFLIKFRKSRIIQ